MKAPAAVGMLLIAAIGILAIEVLWPWLDTQLPEERSPQDSGNASCIRAVDGDTFEAIADLGNEHTYGLDRVTIRVQGVDTPERGDDGYRDAGHRAAELLNCGTFDYGLDLTYVDEDRYGRVVAQVGLEDGRDLASVLVEEGLGRACSGASDC